MKSSPMMNGRLSLSQTTKVCVKEHFLPILKCTLTSPATPIWSPFAVLTENRTGCLSVMSNQVRLWFPYSCSWFQHLNQTSMKNTYPPVSILSSFLVCNPSVVNCEVSPDKLGSSLPVACAHAESYTSLGKLKTRMKLSFSTALMVLMSVTPACLVLLTLLLNHFAMRRQKYSCWILQDSRIWRPL